MTRAAARLVPLVCGLIALFAALAHSQTSCGDCNQDGAPTVTIIDSLTAAQIAVGTSVPSAQQDCDCDVDSTGSISILDSLLMAQSAVGLSVSLTCTSTSCVSDELTFSAGAASSLLSSTVTTAGTAAPVWSIDFQEAGGDSRDSTLSSLILRAGPGNQVSDWTLAIGGAELRDGVSAIGAAVVGSDTLTFAGLAHLVPEGGASTIELRVFLVGAMGALSGLDNDSLVFSLDPADIVLAAGSSGIDPGQTAVDSGAGNVAIDIAATQLAYTIQPMTPVQFAQNMAPIALEATDLNGNLDEDFAESVTASRQGGVGMLASSDAGGLTHSFVAGAVSWADLTLPAVTTMMVRATTSPSGLQADSIPVTVTAFSGPEVTYTSGASPSTLPSTADTFGERVASWDLLFQDGGADGSATTVQALVVRTAPGDEIPNWMTALGGAELRAGATPLATGSIAPGSITFTGLSRVISEGASETLTVHLFLSATPNALDGLDNDRFVLGLAPVDVTLAPGGSQLSGGQGLETSSATGLDISISATQIDFSTQPMTPVQVGQNMAPVVLEAIDDNSNLDEDFTESVTLSRLSGAGTLSSTDAGGLTHSFLAGQASWANLSHSTTTVMTVRATNAPSGFVADSTPVTVTAIDEITYGSGASPVSIPSTADTMGAQIPAWDVDFVDAGGDGVSGILQALVIRQGAGNEIPDWQATMGGAELRAGAAVVASGVISPTSITFSPFSRVVADGSSVTLTVHLFLSSTPDALDGLDNDRLVLSLAPGDVTLMAGGSQLDPAQGVESSGAASLDITVTAAALAFTTQPMTPVQVGQNMAPIALEAIDDNSNLDEDFIESVMLSPQGGSGSLSSLDAGGLTHAFLAGTVAWADLSHSTPETIDVRATATPSGFLVDSVSVTVTAFIGTDVTYASGAAPVTIPSSADTPGEQIAAWDIDFQDAGTDGTPTTVQGLVLRAGAGNEIPDWMAALGGAELRAGALVLGTGVISPTSITFTGFARGILDGSAGTLTVHLYLTSVADALDGLDNDRFVLSLAPGDVTLSPVGSQLDPGQGIENSGAGNLDIAVTAAMLAYTTQPMTPVPAGSNMAPIALEATDDNSNLDDDFSEPATLSRVMGSGALASTDPGGLTRAFSGGTVSWANLSASVASVITVRATASPSGLLVDSNGVTVTPLAELTYTSGASPVTISSAADTFGTRVASWDILFTDAGGDGVAASPTLLILRPGAGNEIPDWMATLGGAELRAGAVALSTGILAPASITFPGISLSIADGGMETLTLHLYMSAVTDALDGLDNDRFVFGLAPGDVTLSASGSQLAVGQGVESSSATALDIDVTAAALDYTTHPLTAVLVGQNMAPVVIEAIDLNSNFDEDFAESVTLNRQGGTGTLASTDPGGLTGMFAAGVASWANLTLSAAATIQVRATASPSGLQISSSNIVVSAFAGAEVTYTSGASPVTIPSTVDTLGERVAAWDVDVLDAGGDGSTATVQALVLRPGAGNEIADWMSAVGGAELRAGAVSLAAGTLAPASITFTGFSRVIADGAADTLTVHLFLNGTPDALDGLDNDRFVFDLAPGDFTLAGGGSQLAGAQGSETSSATALDITVTAADISFTTQPSTPVTTVQNMAPIALEAIDGNANLDEDFAEDATLAPVGTAGTLASLDAGGLTHTFSAGTVAWSDLTFDTAGGIVVRCTTSLSVFSDDSAPVVVVGGTMIVSVFPDRGPAEGGNHVQILGTGFVAGQSVTIGGDACTDVLLLSPGRISARVPRASAAEAGTSVDVAVGAIVSVGAYFYFSDSVGPAVLETLPDLFTDDLATTHRLAFHLDSTIDPGTVVGPSPAVNTSTALAQGSFLSGSAFASEDDRWVVLRRSSGTWTSGGSQILGFLFGEIAGVNAIADVHGNPMVTFGFSVAGRAVDAFFSANPPTVVVDSTAPTVVSTTPAAGALATRRGAAIEVRFSEAMDPTTIRQFAGGPLTAGTFELRDTSTMMPVPGRLELQSDGRRVLFHPDAELAASTGHEIRLTDSGATARVEDLAGNGLATTVISFTTAGTTGLTVTSCDPTGGPLVGGGSVRVLGEGFGPGATATIGGRPLTGVIRRSSSELEGVAPPGAAAGPADVVVTNPGGVSDTAFGAYAYLTSPPTDLQRPELVSVFPAANSGGTLPCPNNSGFVIVVSEPMDTSASAFTIGAAESIQFLGTPSSGVITALASDPRIIVIQPGAGFSSAPGLFLIAERPAIPTVGMRDLAGNRLLTDHPALRFGSISGNPTVGLGYVLGAADAGAPAYGARTPAPGSVSNSAAATISILFTEVIDPLSVETTLAISDGLGAVPGGLSFDRETMDSFVFTPSRDLMGVVTVDARLVADLAGNTVGGATYAFSVLGDTSPPSVDDVTLNGIPDYINGGVASGGGSAAGGRLRVPPTGFTIDLTYSDVGGRVSLTQSDFTITSSTVVGGHAAGVNLAPLFPPGFFQADEQGATFLVPPSLPFPAGTTAAGAVVSTINCLVRDQAGNSSPPVAFIFDCVEPLGVYAALDGAPDEWFLEFFRDHETTTYSFAAYSVTAPGATGCPGGDGEVDFDDDLRGFGLNSLPPFAPSGTTLVSSGGLSINAAASNWVKNRIIYHLYGMYGAAVSWSDGNLNPGFAGILDPPIDGSLEAANIRFRHTAVPTGPSTNRMAFGGFDTAGTLGRANFDTQNLKRSHDDGETCFSTNLGIFTQNRVASEYDATPSSPGSVFRQSFDVVTPFTGAVTPNPVGNDADDPFVLDPLLDPSTFVGARLTRYKAVLKALDAMAVSVAATTAHEIGHSLGLIENGNPGVGLYGNAPAFPGSTSAHVKVTSFYPGNGTNIMSPSGSMGESLSRLTSFNELVQAYLQNRCLVVQ